MALNRQNKRRKKQGPGRNPFPGLRPFGINESHLFFGREGQSEEILSKLEKNKFVAVLGASGSGKSSLIYCGLIPVLYGGFIPSIGSYWRVIAARPGNSPLKNLAKSFVDNSIENTFTGHPPSKEEYNFRLESSNAILRNSSLGLVNIIKQENQKFKKNTLILIDQFEELFRFKREDDQSLNEAYAFIRMIYETAQQNQEPIYVVITMRSDFMSECSQFQDLTQMINSSYYLIPQMSRENLYEIITGPVAVENGKISPQLVYQLLNDVGEDDDQLPILQHALMRTWDYWIAHRTGKDPMGIVHYEAIGKMEKALSEHANEAYNELSSEKKRICQSMFKTLTEKGEDNRGIRRPTSVKTIALIAQAEQDHVIEVINAFRKSGRSFLMPAQEVQLTDKTIIDISHESLMRVWDRLIIWVDEEAEAINIYKRIAHAAEHYQEGKTGLWRPPDLDIALNWKKKKQPSLAWAERYNPAFERTMVFLNTSEKEFLAEEENKIKIQKRTLKRTRIFALVLGIAAIFSLGFMMYSQILRVEAEKQEQLAKEQQIEAEKQKEEAEKQRKKAEDDRQYAKEKEKEAKAEKERAEIEKQKAIENAQEAIRQKQIADLKTEEAKRQRKKADSSANVALYQKQIADSSSDEAQRLRMLSIAQSMSVKSLQINRDTSLKLLMAYQSYIFNKENNGLQPNPDIYNALYSCNRLIKNEQNLMLHTQAIRAINFEHKGHNFYTTGSDGTLLKWNLKDTSSTKIYETGKINQVMSVSYDKKWVACGLKNGEIHLKNLKNTKEDPIILQKHQKTILALHFMTDNKHLLSLSADSSLLVWELDVFTHKTIFDNQFAAKSFEINPKNDEIIILEDKQIRTIDFYNPLNSTDFFNLKETENKLNCIKISPKGTYIAAGDINGNIYIFDKNKTFIQQLGGHYARISALDFSPDESMMASASFDATIQIWQTANLDNQPIILKENEAWIWAIAFSNNGKYLLSGYKNGAMKIWTTTPKLLANEIKPYIKRNMTTEEWKRFVAKDIERKKTIKKFELP